VSEEEFAFYVVGQMPLSAGQSTEKLTTQAELLADTRALEEAA
jgi:hypothetical protein